MISEEVLIFNDTSETIVQLTRNPLPPSRNCKTCQNTARHADERRKCNSCPDLVRQSAISVAAISYAISSRPHLDETYWEVVAVPFEQRQVSCPSAAPAAAIARLLVIDPPHGVQTTDLQQRRANSLINDTSMCLLRATFTNPEVRRPQQIDEKCERDKASHEEVGGKVENGKCLQPPLERHGEWREIDAEVLGHQSWCRRLAVAGAFFANGR